MDQPIQADDQVIEAMSKRAFRIAVQLDVLESGTECEWWSIVKQSEQHTVSKALDLVCREMEVATHELR